MTPDTSSSSPDALPPQKPKGLAVASLVLGLLGPCTAGLGSLVGLVLGIVALVKASRGTAGGKGLAVAGTAISGAGVLVLPVVLSVFVGMLLPAIATAREEALRVEFMSNLKQLAMAALLYESTARKLPPPETWPEELQAKAGASIELLCDPRDPEASRAVAMNAALAGRRSSAVPQPSRTVLFFECREGAPPAGGRELLPPIPRYHRGYLIAFCDGHVEAVGPERLDELIWNP